MYYHASQVPDLRVLTPRLSSHGTPLVYLLLQTGECARLPVQCH